MTEAKTEEYIISVVSDRHFIKSILEDLFEKGLIKEFKIIK